MTETFATIAKEAYPAVVAQFDQTIAEERLSHLYLLEGNNQPAMLAFSRYLAWQAVGPNAVNALRVGQDEHPDVFVVRPEKANAPLKIAQIRALRPEFTTTTLESPRKVFILDQVETMTTAAANSLLKFIEDPAGPQLILMLTANLAEVLPTIRSRAQIVHLPDLEGQGDGADDEALSPEWLKKAQPVFFKWFEKAMQVDLSAFAYLQTDLAPLISAPEQVNRIFTWLHQLIRDVVVYPHMPADQLYFSDLVGFYKSLDSHYSPEQIMAASQAIIAIDELAKANIGWQTRLEKVTLDVSIALEG
ncbi:DNA polymerase III subunit delta [Eupransor demetentiae]|uniref:Delta prime subunit (HolB) n=1 Tax=Eupransor demetentiae TaxID=3109584 RepID=A0ABP0ET32_9LACO|nr:DNA polymerase III [Lactobacillaceae bacterium LMG 33000]